MISLKLDGQIYDVPDGITVLQAAEYVGIKIPTLCFHKDLSPFGGCRICVVEVRGGRLPMTSCVLPASPGLIVVTDSPTLRAYRRAMLQMLLINYYDAAYKRSNGKTALDLDSEFARLCQEYEVNVLAGMAKRPKEPVDSDPNPFVWVDMNKCIQCTRCVRACAEIQGRFVWSQAYRGYKARIVAGDDSTMLQSRCESCGACVAYCPTGALDNKMSITAGKPDRLVRTTCSYCGVGCQLDLNVKDDVPGGRVIRVTSCADQSLPSTNGLHLCVKGRYGYDYIHNPRRHTQPRVRQYLLDGTQRPADRGRWVDVDWDKALELSARLLKQAARSQKAGVITSARLTNEENYLLGKLARQGLGSHNIDQGANIYLSSLTESLLAAGGLPAMDRPYNEILASIGSILLVGSNLTEQHPVFGARMRQAILKRKLKMIVLTPDFTNITEFAALPLYHKPGSEADLLNGLAHIILTEAKGEFKETDTLKSCTPEATAQSTGVPVEQLRQAADILTASPPVGILWSVGLAAGKAAPAVGKAAPAVGEAAPAATKALLRLQEALKKACGVDPLLAPLPLQNNAQGSIDLGASPGYLPGYQRPADSAARQKFEAAWGAALPGSRGLSAREMLIAAGAGQLEALYILGEEIISSSPEGDKIRAELQSAPLVILQETMPSETTRYADILLPGASFAEKSGTFTSIERRIQLVRKAIEPPVSARPDWQIIAELGRRLLALNGEPAQGAAFAGWEYQEPGQIFAEAVELSEIYRGCTYELLETGEFTAWPIEKVGVSAVQPRA